jgi:hypothetical protein
MYKLRKPFQMIVYRFKTSLSLYVSIHESDLAHKQRSRHPITPRCAADAENAKWGVTLTSHTVEAFHPVQS